MGLYCTPPDSNSEAHGCMQSTLRCRIESTQSAPAPAAAGQQIPTSRATWRPARSSKWLIFEYVQILQSQNQVLRPKITFLGLFPSPNDLQIYSRPFLSLPKISFFEEDCEYLETMKKQIFGPKLVSEGWFLSPNGVYILYSRLFLIHLDSTSSGKNNIFIRNHQESINTDTHQSKSVGLGRRYCRNMLCTDLQIEHLFLCAQSDQPDPCSPIPGMCAARTASMAM